MNQPQPPKRPLSSFFRYRRDVYASVIKKHGNKKVTEISKILSKMYWKLPDSEKRKLEHQRAKELRKYEQDLKDYEAKYGKRQIKFSNRTEMKRMRMKVGRLEEENQRLKERIMEKEKARMDLKQSHADEKKLWRSELNMVRKQGNENVENTKSHWKAKMEHMKKERDLAMEMNTANKRKYREAERDKNKLANSLLNKENKISNLNTKLTVATQGMKASKTKMKKPMKASQKTSSMKPIRAEDEDKSTKGSTNKRRKNKK